MQSLYSKIELAARKAVLEATGLDGDPVVRWSSKPEFGDFQINAAMGLAKKLGEKPHDIAKKFLRI